MGNTTWQDVWKFISSWHALRNAWVVWVFSKIHWLVTAPPLRKGHQAKTTTLLRIDRQMWSTFADYGFRCFVFWTCMAFSTNTRKDANNVRIHFWAPPPSFSLLLVNTHPILSWYPVIGWNDRPSHSTLQKCGRADRVGEGWRREYQHGSGQTYPTRSKHVGCKKACRQALPREFRISPPCSWISIALIGWRAW